MDKSFYVKMFWIFIILTLVGCFLKLPVGTFLSLFMATLYLTKLLNV
ncbi:MAG: hypothetical protein J6T10_20335 [Methanobrevibacter sp.]|nr:hypothetical protein [Methanobrevibacter sp.]